MLKERRSVAQTCSFQIEGLGTKYLSGNLPLMNFKLLVSQSRGLEALCFSPRCANFVCASLGCLVSLSPFMSPELCLMYVNFVERAKLPHSTCSVSLILPGPSKTDIADGG